MPAPSRLTPKVTVLNCVSVHQKFGFYLGISGCGTEKIIEEKIREIE